MPSVVRTSADADAEIAQATSWYAQRSPQAAADFTAEVEAALNLIAHAPHAWTPHTHGTRRYVLRHFPYSIVYRVKDNLCEVLAIAHAKRRPDYWKHRLTP